MLPKEYGSTANKNRVRSEDAKLIAKEFSRKRRPLSYLGMPSDEMRDILAWRKYFGQYAAVEIDEGKRRKLAINILRNSLEGKVTIFFGDIEEIITDKKDLFGNKLCFPYDVVFLDFYGTILYKNLRRVNAIRSLFENQRGESFLLLLTFNLKEKRYSTHAIKGVLDKIKKDLLGFYFSDEAVTSNVDSVLNQYKQVATEELFRQKLFVPYLIKEIAENSGFMVHCYSPIFYEGFKANSMIHFAFKLTCELSSPTHAVSEQTVIDILNLRVKEAANGRVSVREEQMPRFKV